MTEPAPTSVADPATASPSAGPTRTRRRWKRWLLLVSPILYVASYGPGYPLILKLIDWTGRGEFGLLLGLYAPILYVLMTLPHDHWAKIVLEGWGAWWSGWFGL